MHEAVGHIPVLPEEVERFCAVRPGDTVVDATLGLAGHALRLAEQAGPAGRLIGLDVDPANLAAAESRLSGAPGAVHLVHRNFAELPEVLGELGLEQVDVVLADLGISSTQLDDATRGLSFQSDGPLDMRLDPSHTTTATDLVNRLSDRELGDLLYFNAQETGSRRIARRICELRRERRITTTRQLASIVCDALGVDDEFSRRSRVHPATRTFLALRMAVNREMESLTGLLDAAPRMLRAGGRIVVISFHSEEDKLVKTDFRRRKAENVYNIATPKPVVAGEAERERNPRSRSAKLRAAIRAA